MNPHAPGSGAREAARRLVAAMLVAAVAAATLVAALPVPSAHAAPAVTSITPAGGRTAGGDTVTITGTGFVDPPTVTFGGAPAASVTFVSSTQLQATTPAGAAGPVSVVVTNPDTTAATVTNGFTYQNPPTVTSISPTSGTATGGTSVTITGTGFVGATDVSFGDTAASTFSVTNGTTIVATSPPRLSAGKVDVRVTNFAGTGTLLQAFTYTSSPEIALVSPNAGSIAGGTSVTITGSGFVNGAVVLFGTTPGSSVSVSGSTSITVSTPAKPAGAVDVVVRNPDGQTATKAGGFTYKEGPTVTAVTPDSGPTTGGTAITIDGTGFEPGVTVKVGGTAATSVKRKSATQLTAITPPGTAGPADVLVSNPLGLSITALAAFTYGEVPKITSITPATGPAEGGQAITIVGSGFAAGAKVTVGAEATAVVVVSPTQITAETPAGSGKVDVIVTNPDGLAAKKVSAYTFEGAGTDEDSDDPSADDASSEDDVVAGACAATPGGGGYVQGMNFVVLESCGGILDVIEVVDAASGTKVGAVWHFDGTTKAWSFFLPKEDRSGGIGKLTRIPGALESVVIVLGDGATGVPSVPGVDDAEVATDCSLTPSGGWSSGGPNFVVARGCGSASELATLAASDSARDVAGVWYYDASSTTWLFYLATIGSGPLTALPGSLETVVVVLT